MNSNRAFMTIVAGIFVGLLASFFVYRQFQKALAEKPMVTAQVAVAAHALPLGARIGPQDIRMVSWPVSNELVGMFHTVAECQDRVLTASLVEGEPILAEKLVSKDTGAGLSATIPSGMRAISVPVNDVIGVAGFVMPGSSVDVLATGTAARNGNVTRTILEDVRVLAAGQETEITQQGKPQKVQVITLLVTPDQSDQLAMASAQGRLQLAMRNLLDTTHTDSPPVYEASLFGGGPEPAPTGVVHVSKKEPAHVEPPSFTAVEVIRAGKREVKKFPNEPESGTGTGTGNGTGAGAGVGGGVQ
jgi:pilus assembly protein CpaB